MNFNIYLDDETGQQLNHAAEQAGESRNALIRQAVCDWLNDMANRNGLMKCLPSKAWPTCRCSKPAETSSSRQSPIRWHEVPARYLHGL